MLIKMFVTRVNEFSDLLAYITDCYHSRLILSMTCKTLKMNVVVEPPTLFDISWKRLVCIDCNHESCKSFKYVSGIVSRLCDGINANSISRKVLNNILNTCDGDYSRDLHKVYEQSPNFYWWMVHLNNNNIYELLYEYYPRTCIIGEYDRNVIPDEIVLKAIGNTKYDRVLHRQVMYCEILLPIDLYAHNNILTCTAGPIRAGFMKLLAQNLLKMLDTGVYGYWNKMPSIVFKEFCDLMTATKDVDIHFPTAYKLYLQIPNNHPCKIESI